MGDNAAMASAGGGKSCSIWRLRRWTGLGGIYVTAAPAGALVFVAGRALGLPDTLGAGAGFFTCFGIRGLGLRHGLALPTYRPRPGRSEEELKRLGL